MIQNDIDILRKLGENKIAMAADKTNIESIALWTAANDLKAGRPPVYINEEPWNELRETGEIDLECEDPFLKMVEAGLRFEAYKFNHYRANMVVTDFIELPAVIKSSKFGIQEIDENIIFADENSGAPSRHFSVQIKDIDDIVKIINPVVTYDRELSIQRLEMLKEIFDGIIDVRLIGQRGMWFTPWDNLIRWTGVQDALMDLILKPEYIRALVKRFVDASLVELEQYNDLGLWASNNTNARVGSGGYGYTSDLPSPEGLDMNAPTSAIWGCGNAQIFSEVSPSMHWEFSLQFEMEWLKHFGMNYYGCCEQLHNKIDILKNIPNLRKISTSPWADLDKMTQRTNGEYIMSVKTNPAYLVGSFSTKIIEDEITNILEKTKGAPIEIILKDISTTQHNPERIDIWADTVMKTIDKFFG